MKEYSKIFIDTNIFLRVLVEDDAECLRECSRFLEAVGNESKFRLYISNVVVLEIGWVLKRFYNFPKKRVIAALRAVEDIKNLRMVNECDFVRGLDIFEKHKVKLGDAMIAASDVVQKEKAIIVSYDRDFDKIKGVKKMTPKEAAELIIKK